MSNLRVIVLSTNSDEAGAPLHVETLIKGLQNKIEFMVLFGEYGPVAERLKKLGVIVKIVPEMRSRLSPIKDIKALRKISIQIET